MAKTRVIKVQDGITELEGGGSLHLIRGFLTEEDSSAFKSRLEKKAEMWSQSIYKMYGRDVATPRLLSSMRSSTLAKKMIGGSVWDEDTEWIKNGVRWTKDMKLLKKRISSELKIHTDYAQLNLYRDGKDYIGYHTDSEVTPDGKVVSISLGQTRKFILRHKSTFPKLKEYRNAVPEERVNVRYELELYDGDLLVMDEGAAKRYYKHCVPKSTKPMGSRINITFRQL
jgi:alkylated DNA repair dioxygenase AlkB